MSASFESVNASDENDGVVENEAKFYEVSEETKKLFLEAYRTKVLVNEIKFVFIGSSKSKQVIKVSKVNDVNSFLLGYKENDAVALVTVNEELLESLEDEDSVNILLETEINKLHVDSKSGKLKIVKLDLVTSVGILNKFGQEKIIKATQLEHLMSPAQSQDPVF